jgi:hypothetical protein
VQNFRGAPGLVAFTFGIRQVRLKTMILGFIIHIFYYFPVKKRLSPTGGERKIERTQNDATEKQQKNQGHFAMPATQPTRAPRAR